MDTNRSDRRISRRLPFKTTMRVRDWKTGPMERNEVPVNLSESGAFSTRACPWPLHKLALSDSERLQEFLLRAMPAE